MGTIAMDDRIPTHVFRFVERELYDYRVNKELCMEYLQRRNDELTRGRQAPESIKVDGEIVLSDAGGIIGASDPVQGKTLRLLALEQRAERALFYVRAVDSTLRTLSEEERKLVTRKYFDANVTNDALALELSMGRSRFYSVREDVVRKFAIRFALL